MFRHILVAAALLLGWADHTPDLVVQAAEGQQTGSTSQPAAVTGWADLDLGLFARVVTSDPMRSEGARAGRLEEFHADDVFLTSDVAPQADGSYAVVADPVHGAAVGLEWAERRVLQRLELDCLAPPATALPVALEYWSSSGREDSWGSIGQTPWQGRWEPLPADIQAYGSCWVAMVQVDAVPELHRRVGILKIRWKFPAGTRPIVVRRPRAFGTSAWQREAVRLETADGGDLTVEIYNGLLLVGDKPQPLVRRPPDSENPRRLELVSRGAGGHLADRTLLRCRRPLGTATIALDDVRSAGQVYVRSLGLLISRVDVPGGLAEYRRQTAGERTILARVREMPDQSFEQALRTLWRPAQNHGPTMLSLACDNAKFIVERDGVLRVGPLTLRARFPATRIELTHMDFGSLGVDTTVRPPSAQSPLPLRIADRLYEKGVGLHANAELCVRLDAQYASFTADIGVLPVDQGGGTVIFQVDVDGQRAFDSGVVRQGEPARSVRVPVAGAQVLTLRVTDGGDGILNDAANWGNAQLLPPGGDDRDPDYLSDVYARDEQLPVARTRALEDGWLPIVVNTTRVSDVELHQRTWVAPADATPGTWDTVGRARAVCVAEYSWRNRGADVVDMTTALDLAWTGDFPDGERLEALADAGCVRYLLGDQLVAWVDTTQLHGLHATVLPSGLVINGRMPPAGDCRVTACIPAQPRGADEGIVRVDTQALHARTVRYWREFLAPAMDVELPEPLLEQFFRATQVHALMAARNEADGQRIAPWIAADAYGPLDTEAHAVILGMSLVGQREFARRGLDFFIASYNPDGMLARGYTLMGTGQHLWTLGEHAAVHPDPAWRDEIATDVLRAGRWIARQTEKTRRGDPSGEVRPEYGLAPPGVLADWDRYAYYMYANAYYCAGLEAVARLLAETRPQEAEQLGRAAAEYRTHLVRAFDWQRARMPVVRLRDGTWVPPCPSSLYCYGLTREFFGGISAIGHDVEVGGQHLIPLGLHPARGDEADAIVDLLEDRWFLMDGIFDEYPAAQSEADWFNYGGFAKLQPHYARTADLHALRDDVRPFIRTYFNTFPVLLNRENLTYWEHLNHGGAWNKTHESAWFLQMTRTMLVMERGDELWIAPFVTTAWLADGKHVAARQVPTRFGPVSFQLRSAVADNHIDAFLVPPARMAPSRIVLRVRHPTGKPMHSVTVNGRAHPDFDADAQLVYLPADAQQLAVRIQY